MQIQTHGKGLYEFTRGGRALGGRSKSLTTGLLTVFVRHTSASLVIQENADPDVVQDLNNFFTRLCPKRDRLYRHTMEGPDDMPAHIRAALTQTPTLDSACEWRARRSARGRAFTCLNTATGTTTALLRCT